MEGAEGIVLFIPYVRSAKGLKNLIYVHTS